VEFYGVGVINMRKQEEVDHAFDYARAAGVKVIVAAPTAEMLPLVDEKVKKYDIAVAIHNHGPTDKHFPTPESAYQRIRGLDRRVGLCIDIGHTVRVGADLVDSVEKYGDRLLDVHMKDVTEAAPKGKEIQVGRGVIDIPGFLRALVRVKYAGVVSFEYEPDPKDPLPGLAESVGYVRGVLAVL
jgi:sugar phosphate isomerase/epimerase